MMIPEVFLAAAAPADATQPGQAQSPVATETMPSVPVATEVATEADSDAAADPVVGIVGCPAELPVPESGHAMRPPPDPGPPHPGRDGGRAGPAVTAESMKRRRAPGGGAVALGLTQQCYHSGLILSSAVAPGH